MNGLILGLYGVFLVVVGMQGNADLLIKEVDKDMPKFIPWALAIVALIIMAQTPATEKLVKPFIALLILNFVLMNYKNLASEINKLQSISKGTTQ